MCAAMVSNAAWLAERARVRSFLLERFGQASSCQEVIDTGEHLATAIWAFNARLMGTGGARAIFARAQSLAVAAQPLLRNVTSERDGPRFAEVRLYAETIGCDTDDLVRALVVLTEGMFLTLADLTGDLLIGPLVRHLKGSRPGETSSESAS